MKTKGVARRESAKETKKRISSPAANGSPSGDVLTLGEAAAFLRVAEEEVRKLAVAGKLPGKKLGDEWRVLKSALCDWLSTPAVKNEPCDWRESNRRVLETAGSMADDETIPEMLEIIYRERKRHPLSEIQD